MCLSAPCFDICMFRLFPLVVAGCDAQFQHVCLLFPQLTSSSCTLWWNDSEDIKRWVTASWFSKSFNPGSLHVSKHHSKCLQLIFLWILGPWKSLKHLTFEFLTIINSLFYFTVLFLLYFVTGLKLVDINMEAHICQRNMHCAHKYTLFLTNYCFNWFIVFIESFPFWTKSQRSLSKWVISGSHAVMKLVSFPLISLPWKVLWRFVFDQIWLSDQHLFNCFRSIKVFERRL